MKKFLKRKSTKITVSIISSMLIILILIGTLTPWITMILFKAKVGTSEHPTGNHVESTMKQLDNNTIMIKDLTYGTTYNNSFLDIYIPDQKKGAPKPTIFWVHGGGFLADDKTLTSETAEKLSSQGYVVVNINYALVPDVHYPDPIYQLGEAYDYIRKNASKYDIDMSNIAFGGDSAGGDIIGQFVNIQVNDAYSKEIDIPQVVEKNTIKAVLFYSALLDPQNIDSGNSFANYVYKQCVWAYFNDRNWRTSKKVEQSSVVGNVNSKFPPTYITDGNSGTFTNQAKDLANKLIKLNVPNELNLYTKEEAILGHEYQFDYTLVQSVENYQKATDFLSRYLKGN